MRATVDPRFTQRRIEVREGWARRRLRWLIAIIVAALIAGAAFALLRSSWLSVQTVVVDGAEHVDLEDVLRAQAITTGMPTIAVRPGLLEAALEDQPWVSDAEVMVTWPGTIEVNVLERTPAAWVRGAEGWMLVSVDGVLLEMSNPNPDSPLLLTDIGAMTPGDVIEDLDVMGAVQVLGLLPAHLSFGATVTATPTGIDAEIAGHHVLFGNGRDIGDKVASLIAIIELGEVGGTTIERGAVINMISPTRPGVANPEPLVEGTGEEVPSDAPTG